MKERGPRWLWLETVQVRVRDKTLTANAGTVAHVLAVRYMNGNCKAWPSQTELADVTGLSKRAVWTALHELETKGLLEIQRGRPARTSGNVYQLVNVA